MPPFLLPAFLLPGWGAFYGDDRLFFNPLDRLGMGPVSVGGGPRALAWLLSSVGPCGQCRQCGRRSSVVGVCQVDSVGSR